MSSAAIYAAFCALNVVILKELNMQVTEPYMDEPFHVPQAQAYCRNEWKTWDPKITTPPGLYIISVILKRLFLVKCNLAMLRLTPLVTLSILPIVLTRLLSFHRRTRPPTSILSPSLEAVVLSAFPIAWFFGFLYYTDVPSLVFVASTVVAARQGRHALAGLLGVISCTFRQTNIVWVLYAFAYSQLAYLRFRRPTTNGAPAVLYDPPALSAEPFDLFRVTLSVPGVIPDLIRPALPYVSVFAIFGTFVVWNGGIVLGDKSNHMPSIHIPQVYYFIGFATAFGWPALISGPGGPLGLMKDVRNRMFGSRTRIAITVALSAIIGITVHLFTIHHPFLLSDNRHYTFYVWRRVFCFHPIVPYVFAPGYIACAWAWFLRIGVDQTLLQALVLPICTLPTLLLTPLLEPRYFLIPYILLRAQIVDMSHWMIAVEGMWYTVINWATMYVFLYMDREGPIRFMW